MLWILLEFTQLVTDPSNSSNPEIFDWGQECLEHSFSLKAIKIKEKETERERVYHYLSAASKFHWRASQTDNSVTAKRKTNPCKFIKYKREWDMLESKREQGTAFYNLKIAEHSLFKIKFIPYHLHKKWIAKLQQDAHRQSSKPNSHFDTEKIYLIDIY